MQGSLRFHFFATLGVVSLYLLELRDLSQRILHNRMRGREHVSVVQMEEQIRR